MIRNNRVNKQGGLASVELAIIAVVFMIILMGAIEVSRLLFTWNTLDAVAQRAARVAAVCPPNHSRIFQVAQFGSPTGTASVLPGFTASDIDLKYLDSDFNEVTDLSDIVSMRYVRASIINYTHQLAIPFIRDGVIPTPPFTSTLPRESLGFIPFDGVRTC